eukprot:TRINITY_DN23148_c0_g1_i2.p1 TRINITY_DN23148_c0_g1~~TRINITY_DN23148_c0_g1_i2.p1  ORF type:complete len:142 (-),score=45.74 TRINITY_DN23148_c0_g1_i2:272-697(-)
MTTSNKHARKTYQQPESNVSDCLSWGGGNPQPEKESSPTQDAAPSTRREELVAHINAAKQQVNVLLQEGNKEEANPIIEDIMYMEEALKDMPDAQAAQSTNQGAAVGNNQAQAKEAFMQARNDRNNWVDRNRGSANLLSFD